ncbi:Hippurate hydrolase [Rubellimicrobium mesophilum DSM 19309]|uniref:Hippurate hydrolase n=1 Tax=Rubellimicrobium mesophilum DSM 19309 TaxID=442562 RepID=A0A017HN69_9RHOB|nr:Hippurate hydrolase [Rubellimicrobium mesophilum DSM 19309]
MPVVNRIAAFAEDMAAWRHHLHRHPELSFDCHETAAFVAARLRDFGVDEIHEGIARTGVVALIQGRQPGPAIGLRADMDALPMPEQTGAPYASEIPGRMHACGHDGHTTMLLGAARYLAETRNFAGTAVLMFQPAEEDGGGGEVMVKEGVLDRFGVTQVYAMHTAPGIPVGEMATTPGPIHAAVDDFYVTLRGQGGHAAYPHEAVDPIPGACALVQALQTIPSRNLDPMKQLVVSVTQVHAGSAINVIPGDALVTGTVRSYDKGVQSMARQRIEEIVRGHRQHLRPFRRDRLPQRLPRHDQRPGPRRLRRRGRARGRDPRRPEPHARDGRGRLLLHAGAAPRRLCPPRQRRHAHVPPPRLRLRRPLRPARRELLRPRHRAGPAAGARPWRLRTPRRKWTAPSRARAGASPTRTPSPARPPSSAAATART